MVRESDEWSQAWHDMHGDERPAGGILAWEKKRHADTTASDDACRLLCLCPVQHSRGTRGILAKLEASLPASGCKFSTNRRVAVWSSSKRDVCFGRTQAVFARDQQGRETQTLRLRTGAGIGLGLGFSGNIAAAVVKRGNIYQECCSGSGKRLLQLKTVVWRAVKTQERLERFTSCYMHGAP
jgi:hypothetical protein